MSRAIRIGNQTAISCGERMRPFEFALGHGFAAFEWFADKRWNADGSIDGWDEGDMDASARAWIRDIGKAHDVFFSVHAPWQANPLHPDGTPLLKRSVDFARDIGADLVNLHLYMEEGATAYVRSLEPTIRYAAAAGVRLSIENTPHTTPDDFNRTFARLREWDAAGSGHVGMCLDLGHANLCAATRNDYLRYLDRLAPEVPLIHLHVHENYGDADTHLTLFTGPSRVNDAGVRGLLERLRRRDYRGALILEQWPDPPELLVAAATRLQALLEAEPARSDTTVGRISNPPLTADESEVHPAEDAAFLRALAAAANEHKSWRGRLQWIRDRFADADFHLTLGHLATVAIFLRFLSTGEAKCVEDGGHFRPNRHAEAAQQIETALERLSTPDTAWILRRLYPHLPSWAEEFRRAEPLTRIRDIAHRNDIPSELKREIKDRLQNKLHRCAGPEDLRTSEELLARITAPGASYSPEFVREFRTFHGELQEFFNATALEARLRALGRSGDAACTEAITDFLTLKAKGRLPDNSLLTLLDRLTALRRLFADRMDRESHLRRSQLRMADVGLEDYAFTPLSECVNRLEETAPSAAWTALLRALTLTLDNLRLSQIDPEECAALRSELSAWAVEFSAADRFHLLRILATLARTRRLAEDHTDRVSRLFPPRVEELGRKLGVAEHAIKVFSEGAVRGHLVFQLSRLVELGVRTARDVLQLPPWETIVPGEGYGKLVRAASLSEVEGQKGPLLVLLERTDGDAELPAGVRGVALAHPIPLLSHLGVRARQARLPFAACSGTEHLDAFQHLLGKNVCLHVRPAGLSMEEVSASPGTAGRKMAVAAVSIPEVVLTGEARLLSLDRAETAICGAKATGARRLLELAHDSGGLFRAPRGLALPFGRMERCLDAVPAVAHDYSALQDQLPHTPPDKLDAALQRLRDVLSNLPVPDEIGRAVATFFGPGARLAVRSSANGEDLEHLAGAGLYDSVVNVSLGAVPRAIAQVWASLWTRRAAVSRTQAGIPHARLRMAVLVQEFVAPDLSFIMHTTNPLSGNRSEVLTELAVGLGETLASAALPGTPYRMLCHRPVGGGELLACATFGAALRPAPGDGEETVLSERLDYSKVPLSADRNVARRLGERLAAIAAFLEDKLGRPQDVEGVCVGEEIYVVQSRPQQGL